MNYIRDDFSIKCLKTFQRKNLISFYFYILKKVEFR